MCIARVLPVVLSLLTLGAMPIEGRVREVVLLFTNDFESAFDPIPAFWRDDVSHLGGAAELTTLINRIRDEEEIVYLFDAGDMFTGTLSNRTQGELLMEMMITMGYDAMAIGNHEFDYGWENFRRQKQPGAVSRARRQHLL